MARGNYYIGETYRVKYVILDETGAFVSGESPTLTIYRDSDGYYYDFVGDAFVNAGGTKTLGMTEVAADEYYYYDFTPPVSEMDNETYFFKMKNTGSYADISVDEVRYVVENAKESSIGEIKSTTSGVYDRDTDSLEAIRDRGDIAWRQIARGCMWSPEMAEKLFKDIKTVVDTLKDLLERQKKLAFVTADMKEFGKKTNKKHRTAFLYSKSDEVLPEKIDSEKTLLSIKNLRNSFNNNYQDLLKVKQIVKTLSENNGFHEDIEEIIRKISLMSNALKFFEKMLIKILPDEIIEEVVLDGKE